MTLKIEAKINIHHHGDATDTTFQNIITLLKLLNQKIDTMAKTQAEIAAEMTVLTDQVTKSGAEIRAKLDELATAISNQGNASPEVEAALESLKTAVQGNDDLIEDLPATTPD